MYPLEHAIISITVALLYSFLKSDPSPIIISTIVGVIVGVFIDSDHVLWALVLNLKMTTRLLVSSNIRGLYEVFDSPTGYFHKYMIVYLKPLFLLHGLWILFIAALLSIVLQSAGLGYCVDLTVLLSIVHYLCDISWFFRGCKGSNHQRKRGLL